MVVKNKKKAIEVQKSIVPNGKQFLKEIQSEIVREEQDSMKDFIKGAYRLVMEKEKEVERLQSDVKAIKSAIEEASGGKWEALSQIRIPARFFNESTLRKHGKSFLEGSSEVRFMDLYIPEK